MPQIHGAYRELAAVCASAWISKVLAPVKYTPRYRHDHQSRSRDHVDQELHGSSCSSWLPPDADDEIEGQQHRLPKYREEHQVSRRKERKEQSLQQEYQSKKELGRCRKFLVGSNDTEDDDEGRQKEKN